MHILFWGQIDSGICFRPKQACRSLGSQLRSLGASPAASSRAVPSICLLVYREHFRGSNSFFLEEEGYVQHRLGLGMKWSFQCSADFLPRGPGRIGQLQCLFFSFVWTRSLLQLRSSSSFLQARNGRSMSANGSILSLYSASILCAYSLSSWRIISFLARRERRSISVARL